MKCHICGKDATSSITRRKDKRRGHRNVEQVTKHYCKKCYCDAMEKYGFIVVKITPAKEEETDELHERTENL